MDLHFKVAFALFIFTSRDLSDLTFFFVFKEILLLLLKIFIKFFANERKSLQLTDPILKIPVFFILKDKNTADATSLA